MIYGSRTVDYLHAAVTVHIGSGNRVIALTAKTSVFFIRSPDSVGSLIVKGICHGNKARIDGPDLVKFILKEIVGNKGCSGIVSAAHDKVGSLAVKICNPCIKAVHAVAGLDPAESIVSPKESVIDSRESVGNR